jgi:hypothetical protein
MATNSNEELGFTIVPRRSRRIEAEKVLNLDCADDIALFSDQMTGTQDLLRKVETECGMTGLQLNAKKTEYMTFNVNTQAHYWHAMTSNILDLEWKVPRVTLWNGKTNHGGPSTILRKYGNPD